jgi:uncharacterized protein (TIGR03067 family)
MLRYAMLASVVVLAVHAVSGADDDPTMKDLDAMQGTWKVVELSEKGEKVAAKETAPVEVVILATKMTFNDDGKFREEITLTVDAKQNPKTLDMKYTKGGNTGKMQTAIYAIEGDTLKICINEKKNGARPTEFTSTKENEFALVVLKKAKK